MEEGEEPPDLPGLKKISLEDKAIFDRFFAHCRPRLADYTFANTFIWKDSVHLRWAIIDGCLCGFANGCEGLTLFFPPIGPGNFGSALKKSFEICLDYNEKMGFKNVPYIECVSEEFTGKLGKDYRTEPMGADYVYETGRIISLAGKDLASKRQARSKFLRQYSARTEKFSPRHIPECLRLLEKWGRNTTQEAVLDSNISVKRNKEILATMEAIKNHENLGLTGMVLYANNELIGFTFGEMLDKNTCSILIEKTDRNFAGSAQYIFSEFCRQSWPHIKWCNVGDDWGIPSLAWTKQSYRPAFKVAKWVVMPIKKLVKVKITQ